MDANLEKLMKELDPKDQEKMMLMDQRISVENKYRILRKYENLWKEKNCNEIR